MQEKKKAYKLVMLFVGSIMIFSMVSGIVLASDWAQFQKDAYNSGITSDSAPITAPNESLSWDLRLSGSSGMVYTSAVNHVPLVVDDTVYVADPGGNFSAVDKRAGILKWRNKIMDPSSFQLGTPAYSEQTNTFFIPRGDGKLYFLNATNSAVTRCLQAGSWLYTPVTYDAGRIFLGDTFDSTFQGHNGSFYGLYEINGTDCWSSPLDPFDDGGFYWAGAAAVGDFVVVGTSSDYLISLYKNNGEIRDFLYIPDVFGIKQATMKEIKSSVAYSPDTGRVYFTSKGGYCFAVAFNLDGTFNYSDRDVAYVRESTSTPSVYNGRVYVGSLGPSAGTGSLHCLDESDLSAIWRFDTNGPVTASPAISTAYDDGDGEIYIYFTSNTNNGTVYCLRDYAGSTDYDLMWKFTAPEEKTEYVLQGVSISDGYVFFGNDNGYLFGLTNEDCLSPIIDFTANVNSGEPSLAVSFTDLSYDAHSWLWDFGDGNTSTEQNPVHIYETEGTYSVSLAAGNEYGNKTLVKTDYIYVDWNPWNDPDSEDGAVISLAEIRNAIVYWKFNAPCPETGHVITLGEIRNMIVYWKFSSPMTV
ncbi:PKD domain-containing protein [Methanolobus psychrotolerans]|uniref:PKD domain-containing protein n=1 Tax=Methanolobus psychrotolerans TaxID=1874706 RepID=UPI0013ED6629|nr:PQQ-binding-like beta-propeller repeat protein [Methanolobus psychrotolerans]